jgi:hypothetical protein
MAWQMTIHSLSLKHLREKNNIVEIGREMKSNPSFLGLQDQYALGGMVGH